MSSKQSLDNWVLEAIRYYGGKATVVQIAKHIWETHETDLRRSGELFYTWQYDYRWAGQRLRDQGALKQASESPKGVWVIA